jgi:hypothetical protein
VLKTRGLVPRNSKNNGAKLSTMAKKQLVAGIGSKGSILTKFIKPKQPSPNGDKDSQHRSIVLLKEHFTTESGKECYC